MPFLLSSVCFYSDLPCQFGVVNPDSFRDPIPITLLSPLHLRELCNVLPTLPVRNT